MYFRPGFSGPIFKGNRGETWQILFQPFDQEGLRVDSLHLEIDSHATFRMTPYWFIRSDILGPLKVMIDQFVSERVLIPDVSCSHTSPLVIVHKKEGGIKMAVDYWEVN